MGEQIDISKIKGPEIKDAGAIIVIVSGNMTVSSSDSKVQIVKN